MILVCIQTNPRRHALMDMLHYRAIDPRTYVQVIKAAMQSTAAGERVTWGRDSGVLDHAGLRALLREALDYQITDRGGQVPSWRKLSPEYQRGLMQDARTMRLARERGRPVDTRHLHTPEIRVRVA